jgi:hypothetical protein
VFDCIIIVMLIEQHNGWKPKLNYGVLSALIIAFGARSQSKNNAPLIFVFFLLVITDMTKKNITSISQSWKTDRDWQYALSSAAV